MVKMPYPRQAFTIGFGSSRLVDNAFFTVPTVEDYLKLEKILSIKWGKLYLRTKKITQTESSMQLNVNKITIQRLLAPLGIRKLCSRFVPKFLTAEMIFRRFNACKHNISLMDEIAPMVFGEYCDRRRYATDPLYSVFKKRVKGVGITRSEANKCALPWH